MVLMRRALFFYDITDQAQMSTQGVDPLVRNTCFFVLFWS